MNKIVSFLIILLFMFSSLSQLNADEPNEPPPQPIEEQEEDDFFEENSFEELFEVPWFSTFYAYLEGGETRLAMVNHSNQVYQIVAIDNATGRVSSRSSDGDDFEDWYQDNQ